MTDSYCPSARADILDSLRHRLASDADRRLREHLALCDECRKFDQAERALDEALARLPGRVASDSLKARLANRLESQGTFRDVTPKKKSSYGVWLSAAVALVGLFAFGLWLNVNDSKRMVTEAVNDHLRVLYAEHPLEVESGGIHQVKPWFEGRLDFAPVLGFEGNADFALIGGSVGYFIDRKAAVFVFKHRLHLMTLFVFRADGLPWPVTRTKTLGRLSAAAAQWRGFNALTFRDGDLGYALVSDVEPTTLERLGTEIVKSLSHP